MNAKMVITVPIELVPAKISQIISEISDSLNDLSEKVEFCSRNIHSENDLLKEISNIDNIRQKLNLVDSNLEDCYGILKGYVKHKYDQQELPEEPKNESEFIK